MTHGALRDAHDTIAAHSRSFSLAARFLPPNIRNRAVVLYAWCRRADDFVDQTSGDEARSRLSRLHEELDAVYSQQATGEPLLVEFARVVHECRIPRAYPDELLAGLAMDVEGHRFATMDDLLRYCYRVAGTVGLMMCHVMGIRNEASTRNAVHLGIAMQITNICRDVLEDWVRGRLYIPDSILAEVGAANLRARAGTQPPADAETAICRAVELLLQEADRFYRSGDEGMLALAWRCSLSIRTARSVYSAIGDQLARMDYNPLTGRAVVPRGRKGQLLLGAMGLWLAEVPPRVRDRARRRRLPTSPPSAILSFPQDILPLALSCENAS